jgi:hypothetical protein
MKLLHNVPFPIGKVAIPLMMHGDLQVLVIALMILPINRCKTIDLKLQIKGLKF